MFFEGLDRQVPVQLVELPIERPGVFHSTDGGDKVDHARELGAVSRLEGDDVVRRLQLDVLGRADLVGRSQEVRALGV